jgi:predicted nucleotidyltransferase
MRERVIEHLNQIAKTYNIRILYACEAGSRAIGTETDESDYDVRFIFSQSLRSYLSVQPFRQVIVDETVPDIEYHGWDLFKALDLCQKSNPSLYEWLASPLIYEKDDYFYSKMKRIIYAHYSLRTLFQHYESLATKNVKELRQKEVCSKSYVKTYLQALRGALAMKWIGKYVSLPPLALIELADTDEQIENLIHLLTKAKMDRHFMTNVPNPTMLEEMVYTTSQKLHQLPEREKVDTQKLNELAWSLLNI